MFAFCATLPQKTKVAPKHKAEPVGSPARAKVASKRKAEPVGSPLRTKKHKKGWKNGNNALDEY